MLYDDKKLIKLYREFNREYHADELPDDIDVFWSSEGMSECYGSVWTEDGEWYLQIDPELHISMRQAKFTLHHEMAHIASGDMTHGWQFQQEMRRLADLGAFRALW
jgi:hypothetical protein